MDETKELFRDILACLPDTDAAIAVLTHRFNNPDSANAVIYHLRLLAASWLKGNPDLYQDFIPGEGGIAGYCQDWIERPDREIEHLGITFLCNILLKPAGLVLEIAYLDRSEGDQVNVYRFLDDDSSSQATAATGFGNVIYLLYRPDHYDILYRQAPPPPPPLPVDVQVHRAANFSHNVDIATNTSDLQAFTSEVDMSVLTLLPGFGGLGTPPGGGLGALVPGPAPPPLGEAYSTPSPSSPWMAQPQYSDAYSPVYDAVQAQEVSEPVQQEPPPPPEASPPARTKQQPSYPLRFSMWQYLEPMKEPPVTPSRPRGEQTCETHAFRNSHFNKAHFNNPDFQPEEYRPDDDDREKETGAETGLKSCKKKGTKEQGPT